MSFELYYLFRRVVDICEYLYRISVHGSVILNYGSGFRRPMNYGSGFGSNLDIFVAIKKHVI
jgi:hypothetical protein